MWNRIPMDRLQRIFGDEVTREQVARMDSAERTRRLREFSYKVTNIANKRIDRIDQSGVVSPAYRHWMDDDGGVRFGIRGMDDSGVVQEIQRAERFNNMQTSTLSGANKYLKDIGERLGLEVTDRLSIQGLSAKVFEVTSKVDQILRSGGGGTAIGSDELQRYVARFIQVNNVADMDTDDLVAMISSYDVYGDIQSGITRRVEQEVEDQLSGFGSFLS